MKMSFDLKELTPAIKMKLASANDLVRMAFFSAARNNGLNFLYFQNDEKKWVIGFLTGVAGYYVLRGVPMFFYVEVDEIPKDKRFVQYSAKEKEKWDFAVSTSEPTKWNYLPIIELAEQPKFF